MKKIIMLFVAFFLVVVAGAYVWYQSAYGGSSYYVQVLVNGDKITETDDRGATFYRYAYHQKAYNPQGKSKRITFTADHNLRQSAYLKLTYNAKKGVTNWEEVKWRQISKKAQERLSQAA